MSEAKDLHWAEEYKTLKRRVKARCYAITHMLQSNQIKLEAMEAEVRAFEIKVKDKILRAAVNEQMRDLKLQISICVDQSVDQIESVRELCVKINKLVRENTHPSIHDRLMIDPVVLMSEAAAVTQMVLKVTKD